MEAVDARHDATPALAVATTGPRIHVANGARQHLEGFGAGKADAGSCPGVWDRTACHRLGGRSKMNNCINAPATAEGAVC